VRSLTNACGRSWGTWRRGAEMGAAQQIVRGHGIRL